MLIPLVFICAALLHLPGDTFLLMFRNFPVPFVWLQFFFRIKAEDLAVG